MGRLDRGDKWVTSKEHETKGGQEKIIGKTHTDTQHYDSWGEADSGKLKVSGDKSESTMRDIRPPK